MRTNRVFWGLVVILLGTLLLLQTLGVLAWNAWTYFWPAFLILLGIWFLLGPRMARRNLETQHVSIPLDAASEASIEFNHGAGRLNVSSPAGMNALLEGDFVGGVKHSLQRSGSQARLKVSADPDFIVGFPWVGGHEGFRWDILLAENLPLDLVFNTGAGESQIDLRRTMLRSLDLKTGASSTTLTLPERAGHTRVKVQAGAAAVVLRVPEGVAARIIMNSGLVGTKIDTTRFPMRGANYESPDFESAANRVEITVEAGVGSIEIVTA